MQKTVLFIILIPLLSSALFLVPGAYYDQDDEWTYFVGLGFTGDIERYPKHAFYRMKGDTTAGEPIILNKYITGEMRYAPETEAIRGELHFDVPLFGIGTKLWARYTDANTADPRKINIFPTDTVEMENSISPDQKVNELLVRLDQRYKAGIQTYWGIFGEYRQAKYESEYSITSIGFEKESEKKQSEYVGGGLFFGYDTRNGDMDPYDQSLSFYIEISGSYLLTDSADADYIVSENDIKEAPKGAVKFYIEQLLFTPTTSLPIEIPLLTVQAPTVIALKTAIGYYPMDVPQLIAFRGNDGPLFRGLRQNSLAGNSFFILSMDFRISPVERMYTPVTLLHLIAPRLIPDTRADVQIIMFSDIGKYWGANPEKQLYTWGVGLGMKFSKRLSTRVEFAWNSTQDTWTTYFFIRPPF